ncbi:MAG: baseplate J/gp47 family protein, partial [Burkholderiales bacterium]|nr:baseplate J/gp47 family protein [Burkholderiales bacterium]
ALAAGLISQQQPPHPAVASITQPAMSQDGLPSENDETFAVRAAERLAHKGRALTARDYEKLVLDHFPSVAMVKAIRQPQAGKMRSGVRLIVAPQPESADLLQPLPSRKLQADILAKIQTIMPPDTQLNISAPSYLVYRLNCNLVLNPDYEAGATLQKLNQRLIQFLSPWANTQRLGARFYLSEASDFLAAQIEISHVVAIRGETSQDGTHWLSSPKPWLETQSNMEILVPAGQHLFQQLAHADDVFEGLSTTALEFDFQVYPDLLPISSPLTGIGQSRVGINLAIS